MTRHHARPQPPDGHWEKVKVPHGCAIKGCDDQTPGNRIFTLKDTGQLFRICDAHYEMGQERIREMTGEEPPPVPTWMPPPGAAPRPRD